MDTLTNIPKERWLEEFKKLLTSPKPSIGFNLLWDLGVFEKHFPMFKEFKTNMENQLHHPEGDTWTHTMMVVDEVATLRVDEPMRVLIGLAALAHDLGKPLVNVQKEDGIWWQPGHAEAGLPATEEFLELLNVDNDTKAKVLKLVLDHLALAIMTTNTKPKRGLRRLARRLHPATITELWHLAKSDMRGRGTSKEKKEEKGKELDELFVLAKELEVSDKKPAHILTGKELLAEGFKPGPEVGVMIKMLNSLHERMGLTKEELLMSVRAGFEEFER